MITHRRSALVLMLPATIMVLAFLAVPLLLLLRYSFNRFVPGQFMVDALTLDNYAKCLTDPFYFAVLKTTLLMAIGVTVACLVTGFPPALYLARTTSRFKAILVLAVILPLFVGNAVRAAGWMVAFGQKGIFNYLLGLFFPLSPPWTIMYTPGAVFVGIIAVNLPFVVLTLQSVLEGIDRSSEEAALSLGATPFEAWRLVTLPLAIPGVLAAAVLCFILTMNAYATPVLLGGPRFQMMAPLVANEVLNQSNWPLGASLSFVLMLVTLLLTAMVNLVVVRRYSH
jgi:putative spermidine/putrescine transport system permease protein